MSARSSCRWLPLLAAALLFAIFLAGCTTAPQAPPPTTPVPTTVMTTMPATTVMTTVPTTTLPPTAIATTAPPVATTPVPTTPSAPAAVAVAIQGFAFSPATVEIAKGTTVTWTNQDAAPHTVISDMTQSFASPTLGQGQSWSFTFTQAGSFPYHCSIHTAMHGNVIVR